MYLLAPHKNTAPSPVQPIAIEHLSNLNHLNQMRLKPFSDKVDPSKARYRGVQPGVAS